MIKSGNLFKKKRINSTKTAEKVDYILRLHAKYNFVLYFCAKFQINDPKKK